MIGEYEARILSNYDLLYEDLALPDLIGMTTLSQIFARRTTSKHNKHVLFTLFGETGSGKSMVAIETARRTSEVITKSLGGKPSDYFTFENMALIDPDDLRETLTTMEPYQIYILDDAGPAIDSRAFMSEVNKTLSHVLQTCRTTNNTIIINAPDPKFVDIAARRLSTFHGEVSESMHAQGLTFLKVFRVRRMFRTDKTLYPFLRYHGQVVTRFRAPMPPDDWVGRYDEARTRLQLRLAERANATMHGNSGSSFGSQKITPADRRLQAILTEHGDEILQLRQEHPEMTVYRMSLRLGITRSMVAKACRNLGVPFA